MWREYSIRYIRENKMSSVTIAAAAFLASSLLSLLLTFFYNLLEDHIRRNGRNFAAALLIAYGFVLAAACLSLVAMIHNVFEVSMSSRIHQLGILQSVGATPRQIRSFLFWEVCMLCGLPVGAGTAFGILLCRGFLGLMTVMISEIKKFEIIFSYHWAVAVFTIGISGVTVLLSAYLPARRLSRLTEELRRTEGVESCISYRKTESFAWIPGEIFSEEISVLGMENLDGTKALNEAGAYGIELAVYILDEKSFSDYCREHGIKDNTGAVALNLIWDSVHSPRTDRKYIPFLKEQAVKLQAEGTDFAGAEIEIMAFCDEMPKIREEMKQNVLSLIMPETYFEKISDRNLGTVQYYDIQLTQEGVELEVREAIEAKLGSDLEYQLESRRETEESETAIRRGLKIFVGAVAALIALIGIANVFSSVLGQIYQRKKEFLRYLSVGMSRRGMRKILFMEALILGIKPMVFSLSLNIPVMLWALHASGIPVKEFLNAAPVLPTALFFAAVLLFIFLAYYLGGRKICRADIVEVLKDETLM